MWGLTMITVAWLVSLCCTSLGRADGPGGLPTADEVPAKVVQAEIRPNSNECSEGYSYMTQQECIDAARECLIHGVTSFGQSGDWATTYPRGCWKGGSQVNFNTATTGGRDETRALVCINQGAQLTVPPARSYIEVRSNTNECSPGYTYMTLQQCMDRASDGSIEHVAGFGMSGSCADSCPRGCWRLENYVYFNDANTGSANSERDLVCIREGSPNIPGEVEYPQPEIEMPDSTTHVEIRPFSSSCSEGYTYMTEQECRETVVFGYIQGVTGFGDAGNWGTSYPKGCWLQGSSLYFNAAPTGGPDEHRPLVCKSTASSSAWGSTRRLAQSIFKCSYSSATTIVSTTIVSTTIASTTIVSGSALAAGPASVACRNLIPLVMGLAGVLRLF